MRMMSLLLLLLCIFFFSIPSLALDNGLGRTPAMGYNSWYDLECSENMNEQSIYTVMDTYESLGLMKFGYQYVNLDDCWAGGRNEGGTIYPDKQHFPNGLVPLIDHAHSLGLKFGLYTDRGSQTCGGRPGSAGYEAVDAATYAAWGVDFLKEDSCYASQDPDTAFKDYATMRDALNQTGRPIFFDLCGWEPWYAPVGESLGNEWRIGPDDSNWDSILANINIDADLYMYSGPGGWNNPCLLLGNDINGNPLITEQQSRTQFSMWSILAAPLMLSQNIGNWTSFMTQTYTNTEVIAVDQDPLGKQGRRLVGGNLNATATEYGNTTNIWARQLFDGSYAMLFINVASKTQTITCDSSCFASIGFNDTSVSIAAHDLYLHKTIWTSSGDLSFNTSVPADGGSLMVKIYQL